MENRLITVQYKLYAPMGKDNSVELIEETRPEQPFQFISGLNMVLNALEDKLSRLDEGADFKLTLTEDEAYGPYIPEGVHEIEAEAFYIDGKMDTQHVYEGAVVPLTNADGEQFNGTVVKVTDKTVVVDLNHPLAGKALTFEGRVIDNHIASIEELQNYMNSQGGCGGCGGDCGEGGCSGSCGHCGGCH